ncbi:MAG: DUF4011 domain-containing protein, partial [Planctomycetota bacterium]
MNSENNMQEEVEECLSQLRQKLLDLSLRNNLLNYRGNKRSINIIDELPDTTFKYLVTQQKEMTLLPLTDKQKRDMQIMEENLSPEDYIVSIILEKGGPNKIINTIETGLDSDFKTIYGKDCISTILNMKKAETIEIESADKGFNVRLIDNKYLSTKATINKDILELPVGGETAEDKHFDNKLQTAHVASQFEARCRNISLLAKGALEETGCNFLFLSIGFLEWYESEDSDRCLRAPLILIPIEIGRKIIKRKTDHFTYKVTYTGEDFLENVSLAEKLRRDFGMELPSFDDEIVPEKYFNSVNELISNKKRWRVAREMLISIFSFSKIIMHRDLDSKNWPSDVSLTNKELIIALCAGADRENKGVLLPGYGGDENKPKDIDYSLILDADSSQIHAIEQVMRGKNYVIHGPPGTGKSQTISNLISCALHDGKSVLFVAEKRAALEVVKKRLDNAGLGELCLELHSHKIKKGHVFQELQKRLDMHERLSLLLDTDSNAIERSILKLEGFKRQLSSHANLVNKRISPIGATFHDIIWAAETHKKDGYDQFVKPIDNARELTLEEIEIHHELLKSISVLYEDLTGEDVRCWRWFDAKNIMPGDKENVLALIKLLKHIIDESISYFEDIGTKNSFPYDYTFNKMNELASLQDLILSIDKHVAITQNILYFILPSYWKSRYHLKQIVKNDLESNPLKMHSCMKEFKKCESKLNSKASDIDLFQFYSFLLSFKSSQDLISWCFDEPFMDKLDLLRAAIERANKMLLHFNESINSFQPFGNLNKHFDDNVKSDDYNFKALTESLEKSIEKINSLSRWSEYCQLSRNAEQYGLNHYVSLLNSGEISSNDMPQLYLYNVYSELTKSLINENLLLAEFSRVHHEQMRQYFQQIDKQIIDKTGPRIACECMKSANPP